MKKLIDIGVPLLRGRADIGAVTQLKIWRETANKT